MRACRRTRGTLRVTVRAGDRGRWPPRDRVFGQNWGHHTCQDSRGWLPDTFSRLWLQPRGHWAFKASPCSPGSFLGPCISHPGLGLWQLPDSQPWLCPPAPHPLSTFARSSVRLATPGFEEKESREKNPLNGLCGTCEAGTTGSRPRFFMSQPW